MIDIHATLERASKLKIAVIGDLIVDRYIYGDVHRISPEAPVVVVNKTDTKICMGGAGNVFMNLLNLGVDVDLYCNFNQTPFWGEELMMRIFTNPYPAAVKTRVMSGQHHLLRIDDEIMPDQIEWPTFKQLSWWEHLQDQYMEYDRIVLVDYHKGTLSDSLINAILEINEKYRRDNRIIPIIVDAKKDFFRYKGVDCLKCNEKESHSIDGINLFCRKNGVRRLFVTNGERGVTCYTMDQTLVYGANGIKINIIDSCGAGDTTTSILSIIEDDFDPMEACQLANVAAAEVCTYSGVHAITKDELIKRFNEVYKD